MKCKVALPTSGSLQHCTSLRHRLNGNAKQSSVRPPAQLAISN